MTNANTNLKVNIPSRYRFSDWTKIIHNSGHFFDMATMRFFQSRVLWGTLRPIAGDNFTFITSEKSPFGERMYTVREWDTAEEVNNWGAFKTRVEAVKEQNRIHKEEEAYYNSFSN
jgi:hypothetical protein